MIKDLQEIFNTFLCVLFCFVILLTFCALKKRRKGAVYALRAVADKDDASALPHDLLLSYLQRPGNFARRLQLYPGVALRCRKGYEPVRSARYAAPRALSCYAAQILHAALKVLSVYAFRCHILKRRHYGRLLQRLKVRN